MTLWNSEMHDVYVECLQSFFYFHSYVTLHIFNSPPAFFSEMIYDYGKFIIMLI